MLRRLDVMELLKNFLIRRREENDLSAVALVTGNVRYTRRSLSTSENIRLTISFPLNASAIVLTFVTFFNWIAEPENTVRRTSGNIISWVFKRGRSIFPLKYLETSFNYPIKLLVFHYKIYYLVMLISEGMTRSRNAWSQALHTKFTRIRHVCLLGNLFKYAVFVENDKIYQKFCKNLA